jgi:hypothetical protein
MDDGRTPRFRRHELLKRQPEVDDTFAIEVIYERRAAHSNPGCPPTARRSFPDDAVRTLRGLFGSKGWVRLLEIRQIKSAPTSTYRSKARIVNHSSSIWKTRL